MLPASLKDDTARMNDINIYKLLGQMNHLAADPKANAYIFLFFTPTFLKTIIASCTNWHIWFYPIHKPTLRKTKRAIFANARLKDILLN